jgi:shikimate kinase
MNPIHNPQSAIPNLFLIGYRGTGKTTVGRLIAAHLDWTFVDADALLEERFAKSIRQIFADEGETGFRDKESAILQAICQNRQQVIATGGGVILRAENRDLLRQAGRCVWLTASAETLWRRLQLDGTTTERRPNLTSGGLSEIEELLSKREPFYAECADWTVSTETAAPEELAAGIAALLKTETS